MPFLPRITAWKDIESFGTGSNGLSWIFAAGKKIPLHYWWIPITARSLLHAEVEKRAFNATGNWQKESPRKK